MEKKQVASEIDGELNIELERLKHGTERSGARDTLAGGGEEVT